MFFNKVLQFNEIYNWLPTSWWSSSPGSLSDDPQEPRLTGSLGCSRSLLAARADASIMDDHGWGILDIWSWQNHQSMLWELCCFDQPKWVDEIWYVIKFWWNLYNHSDWLFLASSGQQIFYEAMVQGQTAAMWVCVMLSMKLSMNHLISRFARRWVQFSEYWQHFKGMCTLQKWFGFPLFLVEKLNNWRWNQPTLQYG